MFMEQCLAPVFVAGNQTTPGATIVDVLPVFFQISGIGVEPLNGLGADGRLLSQPDGRSDHEYFSYFYLLIELRPIILLPTLFLHVRVYPIGNVVVNGSNNLNGDAVFLHNGFGNVDQAIRVG